MSTGTETEPKISITANWSFWKIATLQFAFLAALLGGFWVILETALGGYQTTLAGQGSRMTGIDDRITAVSARLDSLNSVQQDRFDQIQRQNTEILAALSGLEAGMSARLDGLESLIEKSGVEPGFFRNSPFQYKNDFQPFSLAEVSLTFGAPPDQIAAISGFVSKNPNADRASIQSFIVEQLSYKVVSYKTMPISQPVAPTILANETIPYREFIYNVIEAKVKAGNLERVQPPFVQLSIATTNQSGEKELLTFVVVPDEPLEWNLGAPQSAPVSLSVDYNLAKKYSEETADVILLDEYKGIFWDRSAAALMDGSEGSDYYKELKASNSSDLNCKDLTGFVTADIGGTLVSGCADLGIEMKF